MFSNIKNTNIKIQKLQQKITDLEFTLEKLQENKGFWAIDTGNYIKRTKAYLVELFVFVYNSTEHDKIALYLENKPNYTKIKTVMCEDKPSQYFDHYGEEVKNPKPRLEELNLNK